MLSSSDFYISKWRRWRWLTGGFRRYWFVVWKWQLVTGITESVLDLVHVTFVHFRRFVGRRRLSGNQGQVGNTSCLKLDFEL